MAAFRQFVAEQGDSLFWQAAFDALHAQQVKEDENALGLACMARDVSERGFTRSASVLRRIIVMTSIFYLWLQWLVYSQFAACWEISRIAKCRLACIVIWRRA